MHKYFKYCYITQVIYFDTLNTNKELKLDDFQSETQRLSLRLNGRYKR